MKNTNEGILDFFKKDKTQTAEEFFEVDRMGSKGAKGLIVKMLDVMTPDSNIEYKGLGREQADSIEYVRDYIKNSFLGKIDSEPTRGDNENADFAKHMDSEAWGENINFDTLLEAAKELYEQAGDFFNETQTGSDTESRQETLVTLGVNTIPVLLLFHCLKYLGSSIMKMKKKYNNKRMTEPMSENKILEEYILKNTRENFEETPFGQIVVDEINKAVSEVHEIKLALDYLAEQEDPELESQVSELGRQYATAALNRVRGEMIEKLPQMVEEVLADIMRQMDANE